MASSRPPLHPTDFQPSSNDPLDFEFVDIGEAKKALDEGHDVMTQAGALHPELPAAPPTPRRSIGDGGAPGVGAGPREPLPPQTVRWIVSLPADCRPLRLFMHYPKLGNRLALLWAEPDDAQRFFDDLLVDHRGGRQGFPKEVFDELMRLQQLLAQSRPARG